MTILLDTSVAIWLDQDPKRLSPKAQEILSNSSTRGLMSVISVWEMEVKVAAGKLRLTSTVELSVRALEQRYGLEVVALERDACHQYGKLGDVHRDPFDRMLVCQAISLSIPILTSDPFISRYLIRTIW